QLKTHNECFHPADQKEDERRCEVTFPHRLVVDCGEPGPDNMWRLPHFRQTLLYDSVHGQNLQVGLGLRVDTCQFERKVSPPIVNVIKYAIANHIEEAVKRIAPSHMVAAQLKMFTPSARR